MRTQTNFDTSLLGQLNAASTSWVLGVVGSGPRTNRDVADAAWCKAFRGEDLTAQELARRRHLQVEGTNVSLKRMEKRGLVEKAGTCATKGSRRTTLWRWVGEPA